MLTLEELVVDFRVIYMAPGTFVDLVIEHLPSFAREQSLWLAGIFEGREN